MKFKAFLVLISILTGKALFAQNDIKELKIGDKIPEVVINNILNSKTKSVKLSDFKGKYIIIDFWGTYCMPCVSKMPELDSLQMKFKKDLQILTVTDETKDKIRDFLATNLTVKNVKLPFVCEDKILKKLFVHFSVPHEVIIDPMGFVKAITSSEAISEKNIADLIKGDKVSFREKKVIKEFNPENPFFMQELGEDIQYHFLITGYFDGLSTRDLRRGQTTEHGDTRIAFVNESVAEMYKSAFFKKLPPEDFRDNRIILNVKNRDPFTVPKSAEKYYTWAKQYGYCLDLIVPDRMADQLYSILKQNLDSFFNYNSKMAKVELSCWILKSLDSTKYKSVSSAVLGDFSKQLWTLKKARMGDLVYQMSYKIADRPIINETNYKKPIDITIVPSFNNIESIKQQLNNFGLDLVEEKRLLDVIVLSDK